jgi:hypothetical protein
VFVSVCESVDKQEGTKWQTLVYWQKKQKVLYALYTIGLHRDRSAPHVEPIGLHRSRSSVAQRDTSDMSRDPVSLLSASSPQSRKESNERERGGAGGGRGGRGEVRSGSEDDSWKEEGGMPSYHSAEVEVERWEGGRGSTHAAGKEGRPLR